MKDQDFHVAYWVSQGMISGVNVSAPDMAQAISKACAEQGVALHCIIYAHCKSSVYESPKEQNKVPDIHIVR